MSMRSNLKALDDIYEVKMLLLAKAKLREETISGTLPEAAWCSQDLD